MKIIIILYGKYHISAYHWEESCGQALKYRQEDKGCFGSPCVICISAWTRVVAIGL